ncbi:FAD linked oxidase domain protein [Methylocella silvestris BL2]|uniref:FAD linked oxidase domain protein n=1 Tax=Methylocella silvestris (strain DSM 15510 / CIP 108128 / LMG 27833 / NCIMB 13906 / BL2) TaxID=395965 RepID=B8EPB6_METSB|nr:FAD-binding oxidoreductase [Methylocella silvestris]ACK49704.1 FAD linked oxidase domain protein [Methylocella silvestris BL2]
MIGFFPDERAPGPALLDRFEAMIGASHVLASAADMAPYLVEPRDLYQGRALCVLRPGSTQEVAAILRLCNETYTPVVPQGGNTGLVGGQTPDETGRAIVISLQRMRALREIDLASNTMTVEAGMVLATAQAEAERAGRLFPLSLASEGSCTIGGNLASNGGGTSVIAYGNARDLTLGIEAVLADGRIYRGLSKLKKDNTGYDLKDLFVGSEGTLGIITAAVLKLFPRPAAVATAFIALPSPAAALALLDLARERCGGEITAFELAPRIGLEFVLAHCEGARDPLAQAAPWYALLELSSQSADGLDERLLQLLENAADRALIRDAAVAASLDQRKAFWRLRDELSDAQRHEGGSIKHDVSVPVADIARFLTEVEAALAAAAPGARLVAFGHLGDGNIHCNVSQPVGADKAAFLARWDEINTIVHGVVARYGGSISAEHGIGQLKRDLLPSVKDPVALDLMRALKATLDPNGILNPGKLL